MKKLTVMFSVIIMAVFMILPAPVNAAMIKVSSANSNRYGTITVMESEGWETKENGDKYINQVYSVTKVNNGGYVYIEILESYNVKINSALPGSSFRIVSQTRTDTGIQYVLKLKSGTSISSETELMTVVADIVDPTDLKCNLSYSPMDLTCKIVDNKYYDKNGSEVTQEQYDEICGNTTPSTPEEPDIPNTPDTGSVIPYVAIAGGLIAIAGVYLYSSKTNKMYKL